MLEELAEQMREEKKQLEIDKQMIEKEKLALAQAKRSQEFQMDQYMDDYRRQTTALSNQVRELENANKDFVLQVERRLTEGLSANKELMRQISSPSVHRDIDAELELESLEEVKGQ